MKTNRRNFFQTLGVGTTGLGMVSAMPLAGCATASDQPSENDKQLLEFGPSVSLF